MDVLWTTFASQVSNEDVRARESLIKACSQIITERFEEVINREAPDMTHLLELNIDNLITILKSDNLNLINEDCLVDLIRKYISVRDIIKPKRIDSAEE